MKDTPRSRKLYTDVRTHIEQYGGDELWSEPHGRDARRQPQHLSDNRTHLGVDEQHLTREMHERHRGTFP